ncbi:MAG: cell wall hydrolase [Lachnospiraceae bacterium]|nr:cell wall hydrolase [Lachnospiraceae bacterium]
MFTRNCAEFFNKHNVIATTLILSLVLSLSLFSAKSASADEITETTEVTDTAEVTETAAQTVAADTTSTEATEDAEAEEKATSTNKKSSNEYSVSEKKNKVTKPKYITDKQYYVKGNSYNAADLKLLSSIIYCEAGCEGYQGQLAVGMVVMNRVNSSLFPNTIKGVIYQSGQFTPAGSGVLSRRLSSYESGKDSEPMLQSCVKAAKAVLDGRRFIVDKGQKVQFKKYLFFSRYISGATYRYKHHDFK